MKRGTVSTKALVEDNRKFLEEIPTLSTEDLRLYIENNQELINCFGHIDEVQLLIDLLTTELNKRICDD